ncbi:MAG: 50S ribosomal protein L10, partial [Chthoniobacterales bacterium]
QFGELRSRLAPAGAEVRVVKNSFLKRAMTESGMPDVGGQLTGQTAIVMGQKDVAPVAKILKSFAAEFKIAALKIGVVDKAVLSTSDIESLAELPPREILLSQLLGLLLAPATRLVRVLNEPATAFARLLSAKADKGEQAGTVKEETAAATQGPEAAAESTQPVQAEVASTQSVAETASATPDGSQAAPEPPTEEEASATGAPAS